MSDIRVILNGVTGRMGTAVLSEMKLINGIALYAGLYKKEEGQLPHEEKIFVEYDTVFQYLKETGVRPLQLADVIIDFSVPQAVIPLLREAQLPAVVGVTGFSEKQLREIGEISKEIPIVQDYNFSTGVCIMTAVTEMIAQKLGVGYDVDILEAHHGMKVDAPSGTAIKLAKAVTKGRGQDYDEVVRMERVGKIGPRTQGEIGIQALRLAGVVGEHTVYFGGPNERLELTHKAGSRAVFAQGAVAAAKWVVNQRRSLIIKK
ncbi:MAG: Dihydrodipicolinate reductase [Candidatus Moranbacteria bacterium GW2011_GWF2_34_56]|nr:MAG: Dihydrodipicolinate reductase [Candidatus Moranbacteria bacterium GW2011_GWF2_34_56]